jgi:DNA-binding CsgD family transcriptional regulator
MLNRVSEREALERLVAGVRAGQSHVLVLRGEAGVGKTALLDHLCTTAAGCRVARAAGVESEMELAFAGLHALCGPMLGRLDHLPGPQRDALSTAVGLSAGPPPDRFFVGLAVLSLLADAAEEQPLVCVVDDAQWLDRVSAQTLAFVARRLLAERVGLVFAVREPDATHALEGLPELAVEGLAADHAQLLLDATIPGQACEYEDVIWYGWALAELVEAGVRSGRPDAAATALDRLSERTQASGTAWALGVEARCRGLVADDESCYREAIERLAGSRAAVELARARLVYGEWLRRAGRRTDAREQLRGAYEDFSRFGAEAFAERARRELLATGETVRRVTPDTRDALTPQEIQVARLARDGHTNPEIGSQLFISPRTVEYHLRKVFRKLDVSSRKELREALGDSSHEALGAA